MCFSVEADVTAGLLLLPIGIATLREVRRARELPFASLPLLFALHQLVEALVWAGADGDVSSGVQHAAAVAYLIFALPVLPILVPLAVLMLEPHGLRQRVAPFVVLGAAVSAYFTFALLSAPVRVTVHAHALEYHTGLHNGDLWAVVYVLAVIGPSLMSGYRTLVAFGILNLVGLSVITVAYVEAFPSLWCIFAGCTSVLIWLHMFRRRRLPDSDRLHGQRLIPLEGTPAR